MDSVVDDVLTLEDLIRRYRRDQIVDLDRVTETIRAGICAIQEKFAVGDWEDYAKRRKVI